MPMSVKANEYKQIASVIRWDGLSLSKNSGVSQTITIKSIPDLKQFNGGWGIGLGNSPVFLSAYVEIIAQINNPGMFIFGFRDVASDVRFKQSESTRCSSFNSNGFGDASSFQALCTTSIKLIPDEYLVEIRPETWGEETSWTAEVTSKKTGIKLNLGTISFTASKTALKNSLTTGVWNQTSVYGGGPYGGSGEFTCENMQSATATYSRPVGINSSTQGRLSSTSSTDNQNNQSKCNAISFIENSDGSVTNVHGTREVVQPSSTQSPSPTNIPSVSPSPKEIPTPSTTLSPSASSSSVAQTNLISKQKLSFSSIFVTGNTLNINVNLGDRKPSQIFIIAPEFTARKDGKVPGTISGSKASWELPIPISTSGKLLPLKLVASSDGLDEVQEETEVQIPMLTTGISEVAPKAPINVRANFIGTELFVSAQIEITGKAVPTSGFIFSNDLGLKNSKPSTGEIVGNKILFSIPVSANKVGKKISYSIYTANKIGKSPLISKTYVIPGLPSAPSIQKPTSTISCSKGALLRTFVSTACPPGWRNN
jgi:hypothetical protein